MTLTAYQRLSRLKGVRQFVYKMTSHLKVPALMGDP